MTNNYEMDQTTLRTVLGAHADPTHSGSGAYLQRTPLHVEFGSGPDFSPAVHQDDISDPLMFNAIGSQASTLVWQPSHPEFHLPVIDADGGAYTQATKHGSKAVIKAAGRGYYGPANLLRDVLGDNGIYLEVFDSISLRQSSFDFSTRINGRFVTAVALRTEEPNVFEAIPSTQAGHGHLYIQRQFTGEDHKVLMEELAVTGLVSQRWHELTTDSGMGIVRTPWTEKAITHVNT